MGRVEGGVEKERREGETEMEDEEGIGGEGGVDAVSVEEPLGE